MKYLQLFESYDDVQQHLKDIFIELEDDGYDINVYKRKDDNNRDEYRVDIRQKNIFFDKNLSDALKTSVSFMTNLEYRYLATYKTTHSLPQKFYIYLDDRGLRTSGLKMGGNWPTCFGINLDFYI
jgi:hypothetical protein